MTVLWLCLPLVLLACQSACGPAAVAAWGGEAEGQFPGLGAAGLEDYEELAGRRALIPSVAERSSSPSPSRIAEAFEIRGEAREMAAERRGRATTATASLLAKELMAEGAAAEEELEARSEARAAEAAEQAALEEDGAWEGPSDDEDEDYSASGARVYGVLEGLSSIEKDVSIFFADEATHFMDWLSELPADPDDHAAELVMAADLAANNIASRFNFTAGNGGSGELAEDEKEVKKEEAENGDDNNEDKMPGKEVLVDMAAGWSGQAAALRRVASATVRADGTTAAAAAGQKAWTIRQWPDPPRSATNGDVAMSAVEVAADQTEELEEELEEELAEEADDQAQAKEQGGSELAALVAKLGDHGDWKPGGMSKDSRRRSPEDDLAFAHAETAKKAKEELDEELEEEMAEEADDAAQAKEQGHSESAATAEKLGDNANWLPGGPSKDSRRRSHEDDLVFMHAENMKKAKEEVAVSRVRLSHVRAAGLSPPDPNMLVNDDEARKEEEDKAAEDRLQKQETEQEEEEEEKVAKASTTSRPAAPRPAKRVEEAVASNTRDPIDLAAMALVSEPESILASLESRAEEEAEEEREAAEEEEEPSVAEQEMEETRKATEEEDGSSTRRRTMEADAEADNGGVAATRALEELDKTEAQREQVAEDAREAQEDAETDDAARMEESVDGAASGKDPMLERDIQSFLARTGDLGAGTAGVVLADGATTTGELVAEHGLPLPTTDAPEMVGLSLPSSMVEGVSTLVGVSPVSFVQTEETSTGKVLASSADLEQAAEEDRREEEEDTAQQREEEGKEAATSERRDEFFFGKIGNVVHSAKDWGHPSLGFDPPLPGGGSPPGLGSLVLRGNFPPPGGNQPLPGFAPHPHGGNQWPPGFAPPALAGGPAPSFGPPLPGGNQPPAGFARPPPGGNQPPPGFALPAPAGRPLPPAFVTPLPGGNPPPPGAAPFAPAGGHPPPAFVPPPPGGNPVPPGVAPPVPGDGPSPPAFAPPPPGGNPPTPGVTLSWPGGGPTPASGPVPLQTSMPTWPMVVASQAPTQAPMGTGIPTQAASIEQDLYLFEGVVRAIEDVLLCYEQKTGKSLADMWNLLYKNRGHTDKMVEEFVVTYVLPALQSIRDWVKEKGAFTDLLYMLKAELTLELDKLYEQEWAERVVDAVYTQIKGFAAIEHMEGFYCLEKHIIAPSYEQVRPTFVGLVRGSNIFFKKVWDRTSSKALTWIADRLDQFFNKHYQGRNVEKKVKEVVTSACMQKLDADAVEVLSYAEALKSDRKPTEEDFNRIWRKLGSSTGSVGALATKGLEAYLQELFAHLHKSVVQPVLETIRDYTLIALRTTHHITDAVCGLMPEVGASICAVLTASMMSSEIFVSGAMLHATTVIIDLVFDMIRNKASDIVRWASSPLEAEWEAPGFGGQDSTPHLGHEEQHTTFFAAKLMPVLGGIKNVTMDFLPGLTKMVKKCEHTRQALGYMLNVSRQIMTTTTTTVAITGPTIYLGGTTAYQVTTRTTTTTTTTSTTTTTTVPATTTKMNATTKTTGVNIEMTQSTPQKLDHTTPQERMKYLDKRKVEAKADLIRRDAARQVATAAGHIVLIAWSLFLARPM